MLLLLLLLLYMLTYVNSYKTIVYSKYQYKYQLKLTQLDEILLSMSQIDDITIKTTLDQYNFNRINRNMSIHFADYINHIDHNISNNDNNRYFPFNNTLLYDDSSSSDNNHRHQQHHIGYKDINNIDNNISRLSITSSSLSSSQLSSSNNNNKNIFSSILFPNGSKRAAIKDFIAKAKTFEVIPVGSKRAKVAGFLEKIPWIPEGSKREHTVNFIKDIKFKVHNGIIDSWTTFESKAKASVSSVSSLLKNNESFVHSKMQHDIEVTQKISKSLKSIKLPWDVYYRADIPFFEPAVGHMEEVQSESLISSLMLDSPIGDSISGSSNRIGSNSIKGNDKPIAMLKAIIGRQGQALKEVFPITSGILNLRHKIRRINTASTIISLKKGVKSVVLTVAPGLMPGIEVLRFTKRRINRFLEMRPGLIPSYLRNKDSHPKQLRHSSFDEEKVGLLQSSSSSLDLLQEYKPKLKVPLPLITDYDNGHMNDNDKELLMTAAKESHHHQKQQELFLYGDLDLSFDNDELQPIPLVHIKKPLTKSVSLLLNDKNVKGKAPLKALNASSSVTNMKIDNAGSDLTMLRPAEFVQKPSFVKGPSRGDLLYLKANEDLSALQTALSITCLEHADEFMRYIGLQPLINFMINDSDDIDQRRMACKAICRICRHKKEVAHAIGQNEEVIKVLVDMMEAPFKGFQRFKTPVEREMEKKAQLQAVSLVHRLVRSSDVAVNSMRSNLKVRRVLAQLMDEGDASKLILNSNDSDDDNLGSKSIAMMIKHNDTRIVDYAGRSVYQMARVSAWGLGGVAWKPKTRGHKGVRILSFDGGGTRGVLSVALLKELITRVGGAKALCDMFDIICGTSTGGIIAVLLGGQQVSIDETQVHYDELISKIFGKKSNIKLISEQASYDEHELEKILYSFCKDELFLDTNKKDCPRVFCVSTKVNNNPPLPMIWRNYNYPPDQVARYPGQFRINTVTAVRATSAAPTFFTPVSLGSGLYCDGALVANNPTAIAVQEAKSLYPGIPLELVVSVGTGNYCEDNKAQVMGWDLLVNQIIASAVDSEEVHKLLNDLLPSSQYFRLNPVLPFNLAIDEKDPKTLNELKLIAKQFFKDWENNIVDDSKRLDSLVKILKGPT